MIPKPKPRKPKVVKTKKPKRTAGSNTTTNPRVRDLKSAYKEFFGEDSRTGSAKDMYT